MSRSRCKGWAQAQGQHGPCALVAKPAPSLVPVTASSRSDLHSREREFAAAHERPWSGLPAHETPLLLALSRTAALTDAPARADQGQKHDRDPGLGWHDRATSGQGAREGRPEAQARHRRRRRGGVARGAGVEEPAGLFTAGLWAAAGGKRGPSRACARAAPPGACARGPERGQGGGERTPWCAPARTVHGF